MAAHELHGADDPPAGTEAHHPAGRPPGWATPTGVAASGWFELPSEPPCSVWNPTTGRRRHAPLLPDRPWARARQRPHGRTPALRGRRGHQGDRAHRGQAADRRPGPRCVRCWMWCWTQARTRPGSPTNLPSRPTIAQRSDQTQPPPPEDSAFARGDASLAQQAFGVALDEGFQRGIGQAHPHLALCTGVRARTSRWRARGRSASPRMVHSRPRPRPFGRGEIRARVAAPSRRSRARTASDAATSSASSRAACAAEASPTARSAWAFAVSAATSSVGSPHTRPREHARTRSNCPRPKSPSA